MAASRQGLLFIVSAPSGAGKTSLVKTLAKQISHLAVAISHTTRPPRADETDGRDYYFVNESQFNELINDNCFIEYALVFGYYYGTARQMLQQQLAAGLDIIVEIDWQGARQIKAKLPYARSIFILPPSLTSLQARLMQRAQDEPAIITQRMQRAIGEIDHYTEYDYLVLNDTFNDALQQLRAIIIAERQLKTHFIAQHQDLLASFRQAIIK